MKVIDPRIPGCRQGLRRLNLCIGRQRVDLRRLGIRDSRPVRWSGSVHSRVHSDRRMAPRSIPARRMDPPARWMDFPVRSHSSGQAPPSIPADNRTADHNLMAPCGSAYRAKAAAERPRRWAAATGSPARDRSRPRDKRIVHRRRERQRVTCRNGRRSAPLPEVPSRRWPAGASCSSEFSLTRSVSIARLASQPDA